VTEKQFDHMVNVKGLFFTLQAVAKSMIARGRAEKSSTWPRRPDAVVNRSWPYCRQSRGRGMTQSAGLALIKDKINVNGISPGVVDTPMWDEVDALFAKYEGLPKGEKKRLVGIGVPYGRMGKPEDLVGCAIFLASPESDYVVAQTFNVDGGQWMS
jgi:D-sorbitol dehydrogenase (acceptor)